MDAIGFGDNNAPMKRPVIPILRTFKPYGKSGIPVSDWFPNMGETIDEFAVVRSMYCHQTNHFPAVLEGATGKPLRQFEHPCLGSCRAVDKPVSGSIRDLKQRGMLDSTLVVFTSEFGRTLRSQNTIGRDHNAMGFTSLLAGGGVKGGTIEGATDEVGYRAVEKPHYIADLQSTILRQVGLDYKKMDFVLNGRPFHLVEEGLGPIEAILS
jgi:hypothetical protein